MRFSEVNYAVPHLLSLLRPHLPVLESPNAFTLRAYTLGPCHLRIILTAPKTFPPLTACLSDVATVFTPKRVSPAPAYSFKDTAHPYGTRLLPGKAEIRPRHFGVRGSNPRSHILSFNCSIPSLEIPQSGKNEQPSTHPQASISLMCRPPFSCL